MVSELASVPLRTLHMLLECLLKRFMVLWSICSSGSPLGLFSLCFMSDSDAVRSREIVPFAQPEVFRWFLVLCSLSEHHC